MRCGDAEVVAVLLPDGQWHEIEPGSYSSWSVSAADERFLFREAGELITGPLSSVLATRKTG